jgi:hypothetical protein
MSSLAAAWAPASRCGGGWWRGGRQRCARPRPRSRSAIRSFAAAASGKPMHAEVRDRGPDRAGSLVHPGGQCSRIATRHGWTPAGPPIADAQSREKKAPTGIGSRGPRDSTPMPLGARAAVRPGRLPLAREGHHGPRRRAPGSSAGSPGCRRRAPGGSLATAPPRGTLSWPPPPPRPGLPVWRTIWPPCPQLDVTRPRSCRRRDKLFGESCDVHDEGEPAAREWPNPARNRRVVGHG